MARTTNILNTPKPTPSSSGSSILSFSITDKEFNTLRQLIYDITGIEIKPHKKPLLVNRLTKRLRILGINNFTSYLSYLKTASNRTQEMTELIDAITTNKTDFFREPKHYTYLEHHVVPELIKTKPPGTLRVWSSACSTGEEPYTLAICFSEYFFKHPGWKIDIQASDISETCLRHATTGIYDQDRVNPIPPNLLRKYFLRGDNRYKIKPELTRLISFKKVNLQHDFQRHFKNFDIVFCRNVLIYFNQPTQAEIIKKFWQVLRPDGYLFLGHSETLHGMKTSFQYLAPSIYRKTSVPA